LNTEHKEAEQIKTTAPAVVRAVHILDLIAAANGPVPLADLARMTGYPKSTLHGLCDTLVQLRLLKRSANGAMTLGPYVMGWANAFLAQTDLTEEFLAISAAVPEFDEETVTLSMLDGGDVVYLACRNGNRPLGVTFRMGMRLSAVYTATGKAMLSTLPEGEVEKMFGAQWPAPQTDAGVRNLPALFEELHAVRELGYSTDNGQMREGMTCFGAPVFDSMGKTTAGVAVSFLSTTINAEKEKYIGERIRDFAGELSQRLGAPHAIAGRRLK
jgi:hypothetical protein